MRAFRAFGIVNHYLHIRNSNTMPLSSFFPFGGPKISDRIESFREAERRLLEYARTRFAPNHNRDQDIAAADDHHFELFDTPVSIPSVIDGGASACQVHDNNNGALSSSEKNYSLHGVRVVNKRLMMSDEKRGAPLVLLHGYANGSLYFYRNLMGLSRRFGTIYALDMLGWGMSSRPKFDLIAGDNDAIGDDVAVGHDDDDSGHAAATTTSIDTRRKVSSAESFFVESLESWRKAHGLPKMTLAGHSMGGYMSVAYAERYPQHVERLILLSPVGVPECSPADEGRIDTFPFYVRTMIKTVRYLFNKGITPGSFLRSLPYSRSRSMVDGYIERRLPAITCPDERRHLGEYLYQNSMLPGSGEYCLSEILTAGAFAKIPLIHRIPNIKCDDDNNDTDGGEKKGMEVHMIYGQNDWMSYTGGIDVQRACHERRRVVAAEQREKMEKDSTGGNACVGDDRGGSGGNTQPPRVFVHGVKDASHLLMLDNYEEFNAALIIASGGEVGVDAPRPVEFACDEVAGLGSSSSTVRSHRRDGVVGEEGAAEFFRGPRWNREKRPDEKEESWEGDDGLEEKKVEEQRA